MTYIVVIVFIVASFVALCWAIATGNWPLGIIAVIVLVVSVILALMIILSGDSSFLWNWRRS